MGSTITRHNDAQLDLDAGLAAASPQLLSRLLDALGLIVWELELDGLRGLAVTSRAARRLGYPVEHWLAAPETWSTLLYPADQASFIASCRAAAASGVATTLDHRVCAADGQLRWFRTTLQRAADDPTRPRLVALMLDQTAYKQLEQTLEQSEARFHELAEGSTDMISRHDADTTCRYVSPACQTLLGYTADELLGISAFELVHPDDRAVLAAGLAAVLEQPTLQSTIYRIRRKDGRYVWFETTARAIRSAETGAVLEIYAASRDISERKRAEDEHAQLYAREQLALAEADVLRKADRLKSEFLASVSHELRTPLHHIKGYATTLLRPGLHFDDQTTREYLRIIAEESDKLERLIADLLDTSRIEMDMLSLDIDSIQLDELVRQVTRHWQGVEGHHFEVILPDEPPPIPADPYRIQQVLDNLLGNVVRHTPRDALATVRLQVTREEVIVTVRDDGPGIATEHLPHLFERFYQADPQIHRRLGSGLGLFICKGIIEQHGGWISAASGAKGGAVFQFGLPRRRTGTRARASATPAARTSG